MVRLLDTDLERPELTAALDEALLESRIADHSPDTIHLYRRRPASVSIGYFQAAADVVDLEACSRDGVPVVRRISGGGAIYTDERQLVYGMAFRPSKAISARDGLLRVCTAVARALERLGVGDLRVSGYNDVIASGAKVSGSAQAIRRGVHLVHGTVLVDADLQAMFTYLRPLPDKLRSHRITSPPARVTTLARLLGEAPPMLRVKSAVAEELATLVGGQAELGTLTEEESASARALEGSRYTSPSWNHRR
jgi:lipoate-protein ligase A